MPDLEISDFRIKQGYEEKWHFGAGWDFSAHDDDLIYEGRLTLDASEHFIELHDYKSDRLILEGYRRTPQELVIPIPHLYDFVLARDAIMSIIHTERNRALLLLIPNQPMLPLA